jgi:hypothetical protein
MLQTRLTKDIINLKTLLPDKLPPRQSHFRRLTREAVNNLKMAQSRAMNLLMILKIYITYLSIKIINGKS